MRRTLNDRKMKVKINIHAAADCGERNFRIHGELEFSKFGFSVSYSLDGDDCILEFNGVRAVQRRSGRLTFIMEFAEGEETECVLSEGGAKFVFPVFTETLGASISEEGCTLSLDYLQGEERERTELLFIAERWRERDERRVPRRREN